MEIIDITSQTEQQATSAQLDRLSHDYLGVPTYKTLDDDDLSAGCRQGGDFKLPAEIAATDYVYRDTKEAFASIGVTVSGTEYQRITDPAMKKALATAWYEDETAPILADDFRSATTLPSFQDNTDIRRFDELGLMDSLKSLPKNCFNGCTNLVLLIPHDKAITFYYKSCYNTTVLFEDNIVKNIIIEGYTTGAFTKCKNDYLIILHSTFYYRNEEGIFNGPNAVFLPSMSNYQSNPDNMTVEIFDFGKNLNTWYNLFLRNCSNVKYVIFRGTTIVSGLDLTNYGTFPTGTFRLFVPEDLVDTYKATSPWSSYTSHVYPIGGAEWVSCFGSANEYADVKQYAPDQYEEIVEAYEQ